MIVNVIEVSMTKHLFFPKMHIFIPCLIYTDWCCPLHHPCNNANLWGVL